MAASRMTLLDVSCARALPEHSHERRSQLNATRHIWSGVRSMKVQEMNLLDLMQESLKSKVKKAGRQRQKQHLSRAAAFTALPYPICFVAIHEPMCVREPSRACLAKRSIRF